MLPRLLSLTAAMAAADTGPTGAGVAGYMGIEGGVDAVPGRERCSSSSARRAVSSSTRWNICVHASQFEYMQYAEREGGVCTNLFDEVVARVGRGVDLHGLGF